VSQAPSSRQDDAPWDFRGVSRRKLAEHGLADKLHRAAHTSLEKLARTACETPRWDELRSLARRIRLHALTHLDHYVGEFSEALERNGGAVSWADSAADACRAVVDLARACGVRRVIKAKSMVSEEIHLNQALSDAGIEPVETDFGEMICQLAGEMPGHVTAPIMHWSIEEVARLLVRCGVLDEMPPELAGAGAPAGRLAAARRLVSAARRRLRDSFLTAEMGVTGANFAVAESGSLVLVENEANIRLTTSLPPVHVAIVGIEKIVARISDLGVLLTLLAPSATGQRQSCYTSIIHRPLRRLHVVLLDNGRSKVLADREQFDLLSCIRCGACMNVCPVYRHASGAAYGGVYPGPIGAVLMPHLGGTQRFAQLPFASSLCGACGDVCPVGIPLPERLLQWRRRLVADGLRPAGEGLAFAAWAWLMQHPSLYRAARPPAEWIDAVVPILPRLRNWTIGRAWPAAANEIFSQRWRREHPE